MIICIWPCILQQCLGCDARVYILNVRDNTIWDPVRADIRRECCCLPSLVVVWFEVEWPHHYFSVLAEDQIPRKGGIMKGMVNESYICHISMEIVNSGFQVPILLESWDLYFCLITIYLLGLNNWRLLRPRLAQLPAPDSSQNHGSCAKRCRIRRNDFYLILRSDSLKWTKELRAEKIAFPDSEKWLSVLILKIYYRESLSLT
jgi:hypothetical protein